MLALKLIAPLVVILSAIAEFWIIGQDKLAEKRWANKIKRFIRLMYIVGGVISGILIYSEHNSSRELQSKIDGLNERLDAAAVTNDTLLSSMALLQTRLEPFQSAAGLRYPYLDSMKALTTLAQDIQELQTRMDTMQLDRAQAEARVRAQETLKHAAPRIRAEWRLDNKSRHIIEIISDNLVPFRARWTMSNQSNSILGGVMMGYRTFYPTETKRRWTFPSPVDSTEVADGYVLLELKYASIYYEEVGEPDSLGGIISHKYRLVGNEPRPW